MSRFYQGTMVNADMIPGASYAGYVFINWIYPGENKLRAIKDVKQIEERIKAEGLKGWICSSEKDHTIMHNVILPKMGAVKYSETEHGLHFKKEVH